MNLALITSGVLSLVPLPTKPVSPERLQELIKKLEEPRRGSTDGLPGPPEGIPPDRDFRLNLEVIRELERAGPATIPPLISLFEDRTKPSQVRSQAAVALAGHLVGWLNAPDLRALAAVRQAIHDKDPAVRETVLRSFSLRGITIYNRPGMAPAARHTFSSIALKAILPDVVVVLQDDDPGVVEQAAYALYKLGQPGIGIPELLNSLKRKEKKILMASIFSLGEVGRDDPRVLSPLRELLTHKDLQIVTRAVKAIGRFGPKAKEAVPQLVRCLTDLRALLEDETGEYGASIVIALGNIGADAKPALHNVMEYFRKGAASTYRTEMIEAIGQIDPVAGREAHQIQQKMQEDFLRSLKKPGEPPPS